MAANYQSTSRYALNATGKYAELKQPTVRYTGYTLYRATEGDTLESIASKSLGNPRRFWEIADLNPQIKFPQDIEAGTLVRVPTL